MRRASNGNYIFIIFLVIMLFNSFQSGRFDNPRQWLFEMLLRLPAIVIGLTFHEFMHAFSAWKLGDMTPKAQGRVTLNPLSHIDPFGIIVLIFVGFGWGRPVQVNPYAFKKNLRLSNIIVDVAGVGMNFVIAFLLTAPLFFITSQTLFLIVYYIVYINLVLMLFNLLPIPPLDGFGIITEVFDLRRFSWHRPLYNAGMFILMALVIFGFVGTLLGPVLGVIFDFIQKIWLLIL